MLATLKLSLCRYEKEVSRWLSNLSSKPVKDLDGLSYSLHPTEAKMALREEKGFAVLYSCEQVHKDSTL